MSADPGVGAFAHMGNYLVKAQITGKRDSLGTVSRLEYERFCHGWLFDALRGMTFGQAFCKKFAIQDWLLLYTSTGWDEDRARRYIEGTGYIED